MSVGHRNRSRILEESLNRRGSHVIEVAVENDGIRQRTIRKGRERSRSRNPQRGSHPQLIALGRRCVTDGPRGAPVCDPVEQAFAQVLGEHLGIPQSVWPPFTGRSRIGDDRHTYRERTSPRAPAHFVNPCNDPVALVPQLALVSQLGRCGTWSGCRERRPARSLSPRQGLCLRRGLCLGQGLSLGQGLCLGRELLLSQRMERVLARKPRAAHHGDGMHMVEERGNLAIGTSVDVRNRYLGSWVRGFEIAEVIDGGYRILRLSDHTLLPDVFDAEDVRVHRRNSGFWWH